MSKYINVDDQLVRLRALELNCEDVVKQFLLTAHAADVQEVRHGRWIIDEWDTPNCSVCGSSGIDDYYATPYCPHCGAKMDEVTE